MLPVYVKIAAEEAARQYTKSAGMLGTLGNVASKALSAPVQVGLEVATRMRDKAKEKPLGFGGMNRGS